MGRFRKIIKYEKSQMSSLRFKLNYRVLPLLLLLFVVCLIVGIVLMTIDENKYVVPFICVLAVGFLPILILFAFTPLIRNKEAAIEAARYYFGETQTEAKESYFYENTTIDGVFETEASPFSETSGTVAVKGTAALRDVLRSILGESFREIELDDTSSPIEKFTVNDFSDDMRDIPLEIMQTVQPNGKLRVTVTEKHSLCFHQDGITLNGTEYPYSQITAFLQTANILMRVSLELQIELREDLYAFFLLDGNILHIINQFGITVKNREDLDYIVNNKEKAFRQILKYGRIKKKK